MINDFLKVTQPRNVPLGCGWWDRGRPEGSCWEAANGNSARKPLSKQRKGGLAGLIKFFRLEIWVGRRRRELLRLQKITRQDIQRKCSRAESKRRRRLSDGRISEGKSRRLGASLHTSNTGMQRWLSVTLVRGCAPCSLLRSRTAELSRPSWPSSYTRFDKSHYGSDVSFKWQGRPERSGGFDAGTCWRLAASALGRLWLSIFRAVGWIAIPGSFFVERR